jgi:hypothetical protein
MILINASMLNILMFVSETPNKSRPCGFAATKRQLTSVTTIGSRELTNKVRKSFSLARSASCSLRGLSATVLPSLVSVLCAWRRYTITCSDPAKSCDLYLVISIAWLRATADLKSRTGATCAYLFRLAHVPRQLGDSLVAAETGTLETPEFGREPRDR